MSKHYRTIWISDCHLGTRSSQAHMLLDFLRHTESDTLFLVGDIVDGWQMKKHWHWPQEHNDVVQKLLRKARKGTRVIYIPGNHDEAARQYVDLDFGGVEIRQQSEHTTADGKRLLIMHGDEFDGVMQYAKWLAHLGDTLYQLALSLNTLLNKIRRYLGKPYWSLSQYLKYKVKNAVNFISEFERLLAGEAKKRDFDGVVCGHIHHAEMRTIEGIEYYNCGDWVESVTALVEHSDGRMEIIYWADVVAKRMEKTSVQETADAA
ncbi:UDP-2,3-diacylglucosamine diphosphatase [Suttonella sp. R2A3]|uniref:UDP-2,3-diacylglucosamine diphosphatase n=1 Tax=Suttonella sp. R2A3 TaxID=2908648 RepID=UPI001F2DBCF2|nr:UDP-2,3-diacylglucosamine diphosphatase [Suttonella sp. R2A3]UJF25118.1 UDP-2,3-diacylglucosamine diphosphatase [Suttonella sp. R2A3]